MLKILAVYGESKNLDLFGSKRPLVLPSPMIMIIVSNDLPHKNKHPKVFHSELHSHCICLCLVMHLYTVWQKIYFVSLLWLNFNSNQCFTRTLFYYICAPQMGFNPITAAGALGILAAVMGNENSVITTVDLSEVYVNPDFITMKKKMMSEKKGFVVIHGSMEAEFKKKVRITTYCVFVLEFAFWLLTCA